MSPKKLHPHTSKLHYELCFEGNIFWHGLRLFLTLLHCYVTLLHYITLLLHCCYVVTLPCNVSFCCFISLLLRFVVVLLRCFYVTLLLHYVVVPFCCGVRLLRYFVTLRVTCYVTCNVALLSYLDKLHCKVTLLG